MESKSNSRGHGLKQSFPLTEYCYCYGHIYFITLKVFEKDHDKRHFIFDWDKMF